jgi:YesN/AraC family two-component response regulator
MLAGNYKNAVTVINDIIDKNIQNRVPYKYYKSILFEIAGYFERIAYSKNFIDNIIKESNIYEQISSITSPDEMKRYLEVVFTRLGEYILSNKEHNNDMLKETILKIIYEKFSEDLSLEIIADRLGMSYKYLSRFFADQMGIPFSKYLMQVRFSKAKDLMLNTDMSVTDIAGMVGYNNVNSFIRAFRQHEGASPGSLRKNK